MLTEVENLDSKLFVSNKQNATQNLPSDRKRCIQNDVYKRNSDGNLEDKNFVGTFRALSLMQLHESHFVGKRF